MLTNILLIIVIALLIYKEIPKKQKKEEHKEELDKLTEEMEGLMNYKIDDAIKAYTEGGN